MRRRYLTAGLGGLAMLLLLGLPTLVLPPATDQVLFSLGARTVVEGRQLYADFWEVKPPLVFLIYAIPVAVAGEEAVAIRVLDLVSTGLAMMAIFLLGRHLFNERAGMLAAAFYGFSYLTWAGVNDFAQPESFMAPPLALAFFLYVPHDGRTGDLARAILAGLLLGMVFALKTSALPLVLGVPAAELLRRGQQPWTLRGATRRLAAAAAGFLCIQGALAAYLAIGGGLGDFIDIERHYAVPFTAYRWAPDGSHLRFLIEETFVWVKGAAYVLAPALAALILAIRDRANRRAVLFVGVLAALGASTVWLQGKMHRYHWLIVLPLLAPLAGYALDRIPSIAGWPSRTQRWAALALTATLGIILIAQPVAETIDGYRTLLDVLDGSVSRRDLESEKIPLLVENREVTDHVAVHGDPGDQLYIWGFWPFAYYWTGQPLVTRFVTNQGLRAEWAPDSWRNELMADLRRARPAFIAVARGDNQPWLVGTTETSEEHFRDSFPELKQFVDQAYRPVLDNGLFVLYEIKSRPDSGP